MSKKIIEKIKNIFVFTFGVIICFLTGYIVITGFDEIWNNYNLILYFLGIVTFLGSIGVAAIIISMNKANRAPRLLLTISIISLIAIILGYIISHR